MGVHDAALKDCEEALRLKPDFPKAMCRKATSYFYRKEYHKAIEWYDKTLKIDPENADAKAGLQRTYAAVAGGSGGGVGTTEEQQERASRGMADPEIQSILSDPYMQTILRELSTSPKDAQHYLQDPTIAAKISKLIAAGVVGTR